MSDNTRVLPFTLSLWRPCSPVAWASHTQALSSMTKHHSLINPATPIKAHVQCTHTIIMTLYLHVAIYTPFMEIQDSQLFCFGDHRYVPPHASIVYMYSCVQYSCVLFTQSSYYDSLVQWDLKCLHVHSGCLNLYSTQVALRTEQCDS